MKIFSKLALLAALVAAVPAQAQEVAEASFVADNGQAFAMALDGQPLTRGPVRRVQTQPLAAGQHSAEFTLTGLRGRSTRLRVNIWLEAGFATSFVLMNPLGATPSLRKAGTVALDDYSDEPGNANPNPNPVGYGNPTTGYAVMSPADVAALLEAVGKRPFEASKLSMAKEAISASSIRADDLKQLLRAMSFEATRVELAEFAYRYVADRQNFYLVYEAFDFDASVREVQEAVKK